MKSDMSHNLIEFDLFLIKTQTSRKTLLQHSLYGVVSFEGRHELDEAIDSFTRHSIVEGHSAALLQAVTVRVKEAGFVSLTVEFVLQLLVVADSERNVDAGSVALVDKIDVVAVRAVQHFVEFGRQLGSLGRHDLNTSLLNHVGQVEAAHVDGPTRWRVMESVLRLREGFPVAQKWRVTAMARNQVIPHYNESDASGADILRRT